MLDTGSSDTVLGSSDLQSYTGPRISYTATSKDQLLYAKYGDSSYWYGHALNIAVGLPGTKVNAISPIILATKQSSSPVFMTGKPEQGLMGLGFEALSSIYSSPSTVMDAWFDSGSIKKNEIAFHGCPYRKESQSWIDFGNDTPYVGCSNTTLSINLPVKSYFTLDLQSVSINGVKSVLPVGFQPKSTATYSIIDSCTSQILLPNSTVLSLQTAMAASGGLGNDLLKSKSYQGWIDGTIAIKLDGYLDFAKLPNVTFQIASGRSDYGYISLTLGPRQYIEIDSDDAMMITAGDDIYSILGLPFFSSYHIILDRLNGVISFTPGCDCENSLDGYPRMSIGGIFTSVGSSNLTATTTLKTITTLQTSIRTTSTQISTAQDAGTTSTESTLQTFKTSTMSINTAKVTSITKTTTVPKSVSTDSERNSSFFFVHSYSNNIPDIEMIMLIVCVQLLI